MKKIIILFVMVCFIGVFAFASGSSGGSQKVEVAVAGPYSGDLAPYGIPTRRAVEIVFQDMTDMVTVNAQDDQCDASVSANVASSIISTPAVIVVGHICSGATYPALDVYKQTGVAAISPSATSPGLTKSGDYTGLFFRTIAPDDEQGKTAATFLVETLGAKTVAVLHDKGDYGKGLAEYTKASLEEYGVDVAIFEGVTVGAADYSTIVNKIASANVDAITFGGYHPEASKILIQLQRANVSVPFIGGDGLKGDSIVQLAGDAAEGIYATSPTDAASSAIYQDAKAAHEAAYPGEEIGQFYYEGYAAALVIRQTIQALSSAGEAITAESVRKYIGDSNNSFDTSVGTISFNSQGDATGIGFAIYQVTNGVYQEIN